MALRRKHFMLIPYPAFGHITPLLELAKKINEFHNVTFVVSEAKIKEILSRCLLPDVSERSAGFTLLGLQDGVPENCDKLVTPKELTGIAGLIEIEERILFENMPTAQSAFSGNGRYDVRIPVDVVIFDTTIAAPADICHKRGIQFHLFSSSAGFTVSNKLHINVDTPSFPDDIFLGPPKNSLGPGVFFLAESLKRRFLKTKLIWPLATSFIINSFADFELDSIAEYNKDEVMANVPMKFVGPLIDGVQIENTEKVTTTKAVENWLDSQAECSVVYFSFGSMAIAVPEQIREIAKGLLSLNRPFIWSLRTSQHSDLPEEMQGAIQQQFNASSGKFLVLHWAPQKAILAHSAVKVFVSHCGWNSTLESVSFGIPIVAWPLFADQHKNAEILRTLGIAITIPETGLGCTRIVHAEELLRAVMEVSGWKDKNKESEYYIAARKWSQAAAAAWQISGNSYINFMELVV